MQAALQSDCHHDDKDGRKSFYGLYLPINNFDNNTFPGILYMQYIRYKELTSISQIDKVCE